MAEVDLSQLKVGSTVEINHEDDCSIPEGRYTVSEIHENGSFKVGGNFAIWPRRIRSIKN